MNVISYKITLRIDTSRLFILSAKRICDIKKLNGLSIVWVATKHEVNTCFFANLVHVVYSHFRRIRLIRTAHVQKGHQKFSAVLSGQLGLFYNQRNIWIGFIEVEVVR